MTRRWILAFAVLAVPACKRDASPTTTPVAEEDAGGSGEATPPAEDAAKEGGPANETPPPTFDEIGIAECDRYVRAYTRCVHEHVEGETRDQMFQAMKDSVAAWKEAAAGPNRGQLASACNDAFEAAKEVTVPLGCTFE
jgi:hypothetical protein